MRLKKNETTVEKLEQLREQAGNGKFHAGSELIKKIQEDIKSGHWLKQNQCCGTQGCCDNTSATY